MADPKSSDPVKVRTESGMTLNIHGAKLRGFAHRNCHLLVCAGTAELGLNHQVFDGVAGVINFELIQHGGIEHGRGTLARRD